MAPVKSLSSIQAGIAGEYFVAAELSRRGYTASLTLRNTRGIDVLAANADTTKSVGIQVKTCQSITPAWLLNEKAEKIDDPNLFYVFVCMLDHGLPAFYVVPAAVVAKEIRESHQQWLAVPRRDGRPHQDNPNRKFVDPSGAYKDRWDLLGLD